MRWRLRLTNSTRTCRYALESRGVKDLTSPDKLLLCPACESNFLHHDRVTAHSRVEDKEAEALVVDVPDQSTLIDPETGAVLGRRPEQYPANPSSRRSGVVIEGWCEGCGGRWKLMLAQHKGQTWLWAEEGDPAPSPSG